MKRWMIRLAALSTVALAALILFAHAFKSTAPQAKADKAGQTNDSRQAIKPIPLVGEPEGSSAKSDLFANRSRAVTQADTPATSSSEQRYVEQDQTDNVQTAYEEQPVSEQEPRKLDVPDDAAAMPAPRNPFNAGSTEEANRDQVERAATLEPADNSTTADDAGPSEALTGADSEQVQGGRYSQSLPESADRTATAANAAEPNEGSAFAPPAGRTTRPAAAPLGNGRPGDRKLEGVQSPSLVIEKTAPAEIQVGKPATFLIHVRNAGQFPASGVEIHDQVPQGAELLSTKPSALDDGGKLVWQLGTLKPGDATTVEMQVMPVTEGEIGSVATLMFRAEASARSKATRPQLKLEATVPAKVLIGESATVRIRVSNPGTGPATGVVLTEEVPAGFKHEGGEQLEFEVGTLAPGESRELELMLVAAQPGVVTNQLRAEGDAKLHAEEQDEIEVIAPALKVGIQGPKRRYLQRNATYNISISNPGTAAAKNIELITTLPRGLKFVEANNAGQYDATAHTVIWSLDELPPGENGTVSLTTLAMEPGDLKLQVAGKAAMGLADSIEEQVTVEGVAAILFELVDVADPIEVGGETTYEIRVINQGSAAATGVRLVALLPAEMKALDADGPVSHTIDQSRVLFEPLAQLAPKADTMYTVKVQGAAEGDLRFRVQIVTDQITTPVTKEESTRVYSDE